MNQKGISSIVIILFVVGVLAMAGGVYYFALQKPSQPEQPVLPPKLDEKPVTPTQPEEIPPSPTDETANWKTYRNEEYRFEIKYPLNWKFTTSSAPYEGYPAFLSPEGYSLLPTEVKGAKITIFIDQLKENLYQNWQAQVKEEEKGGVGLRQPIIIDDRECLVFEKEQKEYSPIGGRKGYLKSITCADDDGIRIYSLLLESEKDSKEKYINILNQILSTFKFIE